MDVLQRATSVTEKKTCKKTPFLQHERRRGSSHCGGRCVSFRVSTSGSALTQSQQSSDDYDGELSVAAATYNGHSSQPVAVPVAFLDTAHSECDHTRHAASNAAHSCDGQAVCEDPSAQDNRSVAETADLAEGGTCAQAAACCVTSIKVVAETGR